MIWSFLKKTVSNLTSAVMGRGWHWQNLSDEEDECGRVISKRFPLHGRVWFYPRGVTDPPMPIEDHSICVEWNLWQKTLFGISLKFDRERDHQITFGLSVPPLSIFVSEQNVIPRESLPKEPRECGVRRADDGIIIDVWSDPWSWDKNDAYVFKFGPFKLPRTIIFNPLDLILGVPVHSERELGNFDVEIPLPEKPYPARVKMLEETWKRPRWPFPYRIRRADVKPLQGLPVPGKGEDAWDLDDTAIFESRFPATTVPEAIGHTVETVMKRRRDHGGPNWRPSELKPTTRDPSEMPDDEEAA